MPPRSCHPVRCKHCQKLRRHAARHLCRGCADQPHIRERYPPIKSTMRNTTISLATPSQLPEPTNALPGSEEKIQVLIRRVADGVCLWHPRDARMAV